MSPPPVVPGSMRLVLLLALMAACSAATALPPPGWGRTLAAADKDGAEDADDDAPEPAPPARAAAADQPQQQPQPGHHDMVGWIRDHVLDLRRRNVPIPKHCEHRYGWSYVEAQRGNVVPLCDPPDHTKPLPNPIAKIIKAATGEDPGPPRATVAADRPWLPPAWTSPPLSSVTCYDQKRHHKHHQGSGHTLCLGRNVIVDSCDFIKTHNTGWGARFPTPAAGSVRGACEWDAGAVGTLPHHTGHTTWWRHTTTVGQVQEVPAAEPFGVPGGICFYCPYCQHRVEGTLLCTTTTTGAQLRGDAPLSPLPVLLPFMCSHSYRRVGRTPRPRSRAPPAPGPLWSTPCCWS